MMTRALLISILVASLFIMVGENILSKKIKAVYTELTNIEFLLRDEVCRNE